MDEREPEADGETEPTVTPEMVEAGHQALLGREDAWGPETLTLMYRAMRRAKLARDAK
jgi:hypothetical protein